MKKRDYGSQAQTEDNFMTNKLKTSSERGDIMDNSVTGIKERPEIFLVSAEEERQSG